MKFKILSCHKYRSINKQIVLLANNVSLTEPNSDVYIMTMIYLLTLELVSSIWVCFTEQNQQMYIIIMSCSFGGCLTLISTIFLSDLTSFGQSIFKPNIDLQSFTSNVETSI